MNMEQVRALIAQNKEAMIADIRRIVAIPSVDGTPEPGAPFGPGPRAALDEFVNMGTRLGLKAWAFDDQVGIAEWGDENLPEMVAVLAHVDVVPAGEGWSCDPWKGELRDGKLYGRGVADDKGPAVCALYAIKALRDAGVSLKRRIRVIVGTNEEKGSRAIAHYVESGQELPVAGFTPDAGYPLINGEKGIITVTCELPFAAADGVSVVSVDAGVAANAVPSKAEAVLRLPAGSKPRLDRVMEDFAAPRNAKLSCDALGDGLYRLTMEGLSFHGSTPQFGSNAAANLVKVLRLMGIGGEQGKALELLDRTVGDQCRGENLGVMLYDDVSGFTSLCWGILKTEGEKLIFTLNYRYPVTCEPAKVKADFLKALEDLSVKVTAMNEAEPLYMSADSDLVKTLMRVYQQETGDMESKPISIGGGTYAKEMPNMLAFGPAFPGENTHIHEVDECWNVDNIMTNTNIIASVIAELGIEA